MGKSDLEPPIWCLACYQTLKSSLVGGQRLYFFHQYFFKKNIRVEQVTSANGPEEENIAIKEPWIARYWPRLVNLFCLTDRSALWAFKSSSYLSKRQAPFILHTLMPYYGVAWVGFWLRLRKIPFFWIADFDDPWSLNPIYKPFLGFLKKPFQRILERWLFKTADLLVFSTETDLKNHIQKFPSIEGKAIYIRNGYSNRITNVNKTNKSEEIKIVYAGSAYPKGAAAKALVTFLEQLNILGLKISCDYYGSHHSSLDKSNHIKYKGRIDQRKMPEYLSTYRMGIIFLQEPCIGGGRITQKFYDYIGSELIPIVLNPSDEIVKQLKLLNTGVAVFPNDDLTKVAEQIKELYFSDFSFDNIDLSSYSREYQFDRLLKHMEPIINKLDNKTIT